MRVGIIGCGAVGKKRALALGDHKLTIAVDTSLPRAREVASLKGCTSVSTDYHDALDDRSVDVVFISTTNEFLAKIALDAVTAGKHVLAEKPAGRNPDELVPVIRMAEKNQVFVKVGFNHRYHPAFRKAKELVDAGAIGPLMFVRGRYGHGGRIGYEKEWRANPAKSGGGELIDQGVHLIDLSRWFLGDLSVAGGCARTYFWQMPVDDNAFLMLENREGKVAWLQVSCTEWKNLFSFEIYGKTGKLHIEGLGGSYGTERLALYTMLPTMGPPETTIWEYPFPDNSWALEVEDFFRSIALQKEPDGSVTDAKKALDIVRAVYENSNYPVKP